ncbi:hypothetical protein, partial [Pseudomonas amygdali]|uniref:hypothetical protein n=1 Tax=Pseudomonas amygdali TaxID=47877 RepID=UPI001E36CA1F
KKLILPGLLGWGVSWKACMTRTPTTLKNSNPHAEYTSVFLVFSPGMDFIPFEVVQGWAFYDNTPCSTAFQICVCVAAAAPRGILSTMHR